MYKHRTSCVKKTEFAQAKSPRARICWKQNLYLLLFCCFVLCFFFCGTSGWLRVQGLRRLQARRSKIPSCARFFRSSGYASDRKSQFEPHVNNLDMLNEDALFLDVAARVRVWSDHDKELDRVNLAH